MINSQHEWFLKECLGAHEVGHSKRSLFTHLKGTYELLQSWGAPEYVCLAGLFHSVYGTKSFKHQCLEPRPEVRGLVSQMIGEQAEFLVYVFCMSDRRAFLTLADGEIRNDLLEIEAANLIEQGLHTGKMGKTLWRLAAHPGISEQARKALREALDQKSLVSHSMT